MTRQYLRSFLQSASCLILLLLDIPASRAGDKDNSDPIAAELSSKDAVEAGKGLDRAATLLNSHDPNAYDNVRSTWTQALQNAGRWRAADKLLVAATIAYSSDLSRIGELQRARVGLLLHEHQFRAACSAAKGLYNVCRLDETEGAVTVLQTALAQDRFGDPDIVDRLEEQQQSTPSTKRGVGDVPSVLLSIGIDDQPYAQAISSLSGSDYQTLWKRGNLLLLAGRAHEARLSFKRALKLATGEQEAQATEGVARSMRAEDEFLWRAESWWLKNRPPASPTVRPATRAINGS